MSASLKSMQEMLLSSLGERLERYGFAIEKSNNRFVKSESWGKKSIHLCFIKHVSDFDATIDVAIRLNDLEDLHNRVRDHLTPKEKKNTFSMGVELGNLVDGEPRRYRITQPSDIDGAADQMIKQIREVAFPYFEQYSDMNKALNVFSSDDRDSWLHSPFNGVRAAYAVGLAWLLGEKERAKQLVDSKRAYLTTCEEYDRVEFETFIKSLPLLDEASSLG